MASDLHARLGGARSSLAFKAPCRVATTANITLSGLQTIDGVTVAAEDRVLVKNQTSSINNGIYVAKALTWERARDFDGTDDVVKGTRVYVHSGTTAYGPYVITTADPITIGTSAITFVTADSLDISTLDVVDYSDLTAGFKTFVYDPVSGTRKAAYVQRGPIDPTNPEFGGVGDGVADDTAALQAALDYAETIVGDYENLPTYDEFDKGFFVTIDGGGRNYLISSTLGMLLPSYRGIIFQNMKLTADPAGAWSSTVPMFKTDLGARVHMKDIYFECNRVASGILKDGWGANCCFEKIIIRHFTDYGIKTVEGADTYHTGLDVMKWSSADPEHYDPAERTGVGIWACASDTKYHMCTSRHCGIPIRIGEEGVYDTATTLWVQCHAWNGLDTTSSPYFTVYLRDLCQIQVDEGSQNHTFVGWYLGNGHIDLYDHWVRFLSCKWMDTTQLGEQARIRVFATSVGQTAPNEMLIEAEGVPTQTYGGITVTATTVSDNDIVTMSAADVGKCSVYNSISGTGIPSGSTIIAVPSTTTVQISANATANGTVSATVKIPLVEFIDRGANTWAAGINNDRIRYPHSISIRQRQNTRAMTQTGTTDAVEQFFKSGTGRSRISFANGDTVSPPSIGAEGDQMIFGRSTGEDWRVDATGKMLLGPCDISPNVDFTTAIAGTFNSSDLTPRLQIAGTNNNNDNSGGIYRFSGNAFGTIFQWGKSRGGTIGSHGAALSASDIIASLSFVGSDGSSWQPSARVVVQVDTAASAGIVPGRITNHTVDSGGVLRERTRLDSLGNYGVGTTPDRRLHSEVDDATTNAATYALRLTHTTTGTPATGIGVGMEFEVETSASNNEVGARISAVTTDVTSTSEDFDIVLEAMAAGSTTLVEVGRFTSTGRLGLGTATPDRRLHSEVDDASNNTVTQALRLTHTTSGTPGNNIGVGLEFEVETGANNNEVGATIEAIAVDTTSTSEDFSLSFKLMTAGAAATEKAVLKVDATTGAARFGVGITPTEAAHFYDAAGGTILRLQSGTSETYFNLQNVVSGSPGSTLFGLSSTTSFMQHPAGGHIEMQAAGGSLTQAYMATLRLSDGTNFGLLTSDDASHIVAQRNGANAQALRVYQTYTDASNYARLALKTASGVFTLETETAGTGDDNIDLALVPAGTGVVKFGTRSAIAAETVTGYITIKDSGGTSRKLAVVS